MVDRELFELYLTGLEATKQARDSVGELVLRNRSFLEEFQTRLDEWNAQGPHDPAENLGLREHAKAIRQASAEMAQWRLEFVEQTLHIGDEYIAVAKAMLAAEDFDLKRLLTQRLEQTQVQLRDHLPKLMEYLEKVDQARTRFNAFVDDCNSSKT